MHVYVSKFYYAWTPEQYWLAFGVISLVGWGTQFCGHAYEGRRPALFDNLFQVITLVYFFTQNLGIYCSLVCLVGGPVCVGLRARIEKVGRSQIASTQQQQEEKLNTLLYCYCGRLYVRLCRLLFLLVVVNLDVCVCQHAKQGQTNTKHIFHINNRIKEEETTNKDDARLDIANNIDTILVSTKESIATYVRGLVLPTSKKKDKLTAKAVKQDNKIMD